MTRELSHWRVVGGRLSTPDQGEAEESAVAGRLDAKAAIVTGAIAAAESHYGRVDILVNNAASDHTGGLIDTLLSELRSTFEINTFAVFLASDDARYIKGITVPVDGGYTAQ